MSYENKLMQMKKMLGKKAAGQVEQPRFEKPAAPNYTESWQQAGLTRVDNDFGVLFERRVFYPHNYQHGNYQLGQLFDAVARWEEVGIEHPFATNSDETLVFFDTETTGLKGTGTLIFLLGVLEEKRDGFELVQYVLADPSNEAAMLFESKFWQRAMTVVTYNGKSFDWPQLQMRWTLNQQHIPKLREQRQIDLLHSSKRLWRDDLERMKLTQVEQQKLGFHRQGDIPGHLAPIIYFDAVKSGNADTLMKVLFHNEWDLLSLITLYIHSTHLLLDELQGESATTYTNIGKWYGDLKQRQTSTRVLTNVTEQFNEEQAALAHFYLAFEHKREKLYETAVENFEKSLTLLPDPKLLQAYEQLAILYEHQLHQPNIAWDFSQKAMQLIERMLFKKQQTKNTAIARWTNRQARLQKKVHNNSANQ